MNTIKQKQFAQNFEITISNMGLTKNDPGWDCVHVAHGTGYMLNLEHFNSDLIDEKEETMLLSLAYFCTEREENVEEELIDFKLNSIEEMTEQIYKAKKDLMTKVQELYKRRVLEENPIFQVGEEGQCILWISDDNVYCSNNDLTEFSFRTHKEIESLRFVDFYDITKEELDYIFSKYEFRFGH